MGWGGGFEGKRKERKLEREDEAAMDEFEFDNEWFVWMNNLFDFWFYGLFLSFFFSFSVSVSG